MSTLRALLPRAFGPLLGRFHQATEVQRRGIPPILAGRHALLCAPTASGKTEAYMAPLVERLPRAAARRPMQIVVVSPTRALANDLKRRLEVRMEAAEVSFGRYTGEHKETCGGRFPEVAVATPEALDALIARHPGRLDALRALVLDEIHILDGTPRGDQLRLVLERIDRRDGASEDCPVQRIAASATVSDPHGLAGRYLREAEVIEVGGRREIRARAFDGSAPEELAGHLEELASAGFRKVLIFCNSRKQVEQVASGLRGRTPFGDKVFPHHGSLARALRERTERQVLDAPAAVCVATMTMELGIDIGTVDYVLLAAVPASVSSLLQRMGRGSRRGDQVRVGYACATEGERILYRVLFSRGAAGDLCAAPYAFRPGVLVQQALVISGSRGWVTAEELSAVLPAALREKLPGAAVEEILEAMEEAELIERQGGGRYVLSEGQDRRYQRGVLHSNLESEPQMTVIDRITGDAIGVVGGELEERDLRIGGSARRLAHRDRERLLTDAGRGGDAARFATRGFAGVSLALARRVAEELGAAESRILERRSPEGTILLHGLGTAGAFLLEHCLGMTGRSGKITKVTPYTLRISKEIAELPRPAEADVAAVVSGREKELARSSALGPYHRHLPPKLRTAALRAASGLDLAAEWLQSAGLERHDDEPAPRAWEAV